MTPERKRAYERFESEQIPLHIPTSAIAAIVNAYEEIEHLRPVVEGSKALVDAKSGEARALAIEALFVAVEKLRKADR